MGQESQEKASDRNRIEMVLNVFAPVLDLALTISEHISKRLMPGDPDYYPVEEPDESQRTFT